ncbi:MAG TPA: cupin domain-containing protein, partial [Candidatus Dormibacteraeota bacterium]|nr:cupin domain-containing protein [Candidatus Dormibacteraeota bacterium]
MRTFPRVLLAIVAALSAQEWKVEPTWLYRDVPAIREHQNDLTSDSCHYTPIFGEGDVEARLPLSIARFGELRVDPHGACQTVKYPHQEELYFVSNGSGTLYYGEGSHLMAPNDFTYVPPTVRHSVSNPSDQTLQLVVVTVKVSPGTPLSQPPNVVVANLGELKEQTVEGHPQSVLYKLLIGPRTGVRDRINAAYAVADFFLMDFAPGGTNFPHHHEVAEEIYLVLDGKGQMAAGGGTDGVEGLHPAKPGDAY